MDFSPSKCPGKKDFSMDLRMKFVMINNFIGNFRVSLGVLILCVSEGASYFGILAFKDHYRPVSL